LIVGLLRRQGLEAIGHYFDGASLAVDSLPGAALQSAFDEGESTFGHVVAGEVCVLPTEDHVRELGCSRSLVTIRTVVT
jgi:hypothetical protein